MGGQHVCAGAHRGQPPERGTIQERQCFSEIADCLVRGNNAKSCICSPGKRDTGGDTCEAAGQSEVEPVWKTLLQVKSDVWSKISELYTLTFSSDSVFFLHFSPQAATVTVSPVHRDLHTVLCISPPKGRSGELHKVGHGQNHPGPENTWCVLELYILHIDHKKLCMYLYYMYAGP